MQKWEYLVVELTYEGNWLIARYLNEQELEGWQNVPLPRLINRLGEAGWELVGTLSDRRPQGEAGHLFFKRTHLP